MTLNLFIAILAGIIALGLFIAPLFGGPWDFMTQFVALVIAQINWHEHRLDKLEGKQ